MNSRVVKIRLLADTKNDLIIAVNDLKSAHGKRLEITLPEHPGHKEDWLAYGTLKISDPKPAPQTPKTEEKD